MAFALVALLSAVIAITCATEGGYRVNRRPSSAPSSAPSVAAASTVSSAENADSTGTDPAPAPGSEPALVLPRFYAALRTLADKSSRAPVRVLWLGDSHSAADYLPHAVRRALAERFGPGGPGHLQVGLWPYRHGWASVKVEGSWDREPASPARARREDDGVFGLGGLRLRPKADARAEVRVVPTSVRGDVRWTVLFRARGGARFAAALGDTASITLNGEAGSGKADASAIRRIVLEGPASAALKLSGATGKPELFGIIAEGSEPGVVIDTLGINGARVSTPLAWDAESFASEVRERAPSLAVVAYGTNEAADTRSAEAYAGDLEQLVARLRSAAKALDCLVVGPPDIAANGGGSLARVGEIELAYGAAARRLGCAFFSARSAMGGEGGFARWAAERPPFARPDRVHLTPRGYDRVGKVLADALLESYEHSLRR